MGSSHAEPKKPPKKPEDLSAEIRALQEDSELHAYPRSTRRQDPAMTRYRGAPPRETQAPKEKRRHRRSRKKREGATASLTKPEGITSEIPTSLTEPEAPAARRLSEVTQTQPEVIDLTEDD
jgi:hypothetical protein